MCEREISRLIFRYNQRENEKDFDYDKLRCNEMAHFSHAFNIFSVTSSNFRYRIESLSIQPIPVFSYSRVIPKNI